MEALLKLGWLAGIVGVLLCILSVGLRLTGAFWLGGFQIGTLLLAGVAGLVFGCFCMLGYLTRKH
ncbi:MAG: hypothetical protein KAX66_01690 [Propionivibrio sp.]|nr:hypothetical protein [Propionivibrio sp.]MBP8214146.1 hypothetical protein [Propionivibrio sp.]